MTKKDRLVGDGVVDRLADEALSIVEKTDYTACPVPGQGTVMKFLVLLGCAQWESLKSERDSNGGNGGDTGTTSIEGPFGLKIKNIPYSKLGMVLRSVIVVALLYLVVRVHLNGERQQALSRVVTHERGHP
ncbi:MAG: hypothetical protein V1784_12110 [bacterium]